MKIFQVIARLNVGGAAVYNVLLTRLLKEKGHDSLLIKGREGRHEGYMLDVTKAYQEETLHIFLKEFGREINPINDLIALGRLIFLFLQHRPQVVHTHTAKAGTLGRLAAILTAVPVKVHTFHGHTLRGYFGAAKTRLFLLIEQVLGRLSDCVVTETESLRQELISLNIARPDRIKVIPLGLELEPYQNLSSFRGVLRERLGLEPGVPVIGTVSRLVPIKGIHYFLQAAKDVLSILPRAHFVIVGDGELRPDLEKMTEDLGLNGSVSFTGFWEDLRQIYADVDVVVLTSLNEGCPVSIIEALSAAKPVVATAVGGVKDVVDDRVNGRLVPAQNPNRIAEAIVELIRSPGEAQRLGEKGREKVLQSHTIQKSVDITERLYQSLLEERQRRQYAWHLAD